MGFIIFTIFLMGGTILISRRLGAGKINQASIVFTQSLLLTFIISVLVIMLALWFSPMILRDFIGLPDEVLVSALELLGSILPFVPFIALTFIGTGLIRGSGNTLVSMTISLITNGLNAVLAIGLIYGRWGLPELGVKGMGYGMGAANLLGFLLVLLVVFTCRTRVKIHFGAFRRLSKDLLMTMFRLGYPVTIEQLLWTLALFVMNIWTAKLGTMPLTFHQVVLQILELISVMYQGIGFANMSMLGEAIGNGDSETEWRIHRHTRRVMLIGAVVTGGIMFIFASRLMGLFLPDVTDLTQGVRVLQLFSVMQIPRAIVLTTSYHLRARGDVNWMVLTTGALALFYEVCMAYVFGIVFGLGLVGIWLVVGLDESSKAIWHYIRLGKNKIRHF